MFKKRKINSFTRVCTFLHLLFLVIYTSLSRLQRAVGTNRVSRIIRAEIRQFYNIDLHYPTRVASTLERKRVRARGKIACRFTLLSRLVAPTRLSLFSISTRCSNHVSNLRDAHKVHEYTEKRWRYHRISRIMRVCHSRLSTSIGCRLCESAAFSSRNFASIFDLNTPI